MRLRKNLSDMPGKMIFVLIDSLARYGTLCHVFMEHRKVHLAFAKKYPATNLRFEFQKHLQIIASRITRLLVIDLFCDVERCYVMMMLFLLSDVKRDYT